MTDVLRVLEPGLFTTVQDLGRPHAVASGVPAGGAMDRFAHSAANLLVGNDPGAATLECTLRGPRLLAERACAVAVAGADFEPRVNGRPVETWSALPLEAGDELSFGERRAGARAYVAVSGGVAAERWLGSLSTNLLAQRGGMHGRPLRAGDLIGGDPPDRPAHGRRLAPEDRPAYESRDLHVIQGPHFDQLGSAAREALFASTFTVSPKANRMGYRLDGPALDAAMQEILSFGLVSGAVQLPSGGRPILLMADHQTAGGYPVIATVVSASLPIAAQLAPGDELRFVEVATAEAQVLRARLKAMLATLAAP